MSERFGPGIERDARLARVYRTASSDEPPAELDAAILAAAHRAVGARPRPAGHSWIRSWRGAMSVAAVLVLSVSLVMLMREEAPDILSPMGADVPPAADSKLDYGLVDRKNDEAADRRGPPSSAQPPRSVGLKPSNGSPSSGLALPAPAEFAGGMRAKDKFEAKPEVAASPPPPASLMKRRESNEDVSERKDASAPVAKAEQRIAQPEAPKEAGALAPARVAESSVAKQSAVAGSLGRNVEPAAAPKVAAAEEQRESDAARRTQMNENRARQATDSAVAMKPAPSVQPAAPPVAVQAAPSSAPVRSIRDVDLAPDKWLERIEELRKQGRSDEARASLTEFRKRYPDYKLPEQLRSLVP